MISQQLKLTQTAIAVTVALVAGASSAVFAQEADVTTETVKVTASRVEQELMEVPMSVSVVTAEDIKKSSAKTVGDLLQDVAGVQLTNAGSQGLKRVKIRGEDTFRTLVLIDGQKISEQKSMDGTAILMSTDNIERVEVIKGPASVLYGSDAIGGVINIITKKGGNKPFSADASVGWNGAGHGWSESLSLSGKVGRFSYRLSGSYEDQDDMDTPEGRMPHTAFRQKSAGLFLSYDITDNVTAGIQADIFDAYLRSGSITYNPEDFYVDIPTWKREKIGVFVDAKNLTDVLTRVRWDAYWQKTRKNMNNFVHSIDNEPGDVTISGTKYEYQTAEMRLDNWADNRLTTIGTSVQSDWQLNDNHYLVAGYEFSRDTLKANTHRDVYNYMTDVKVGQMSLQSLTANPVTDLYTEGTLDTHSLFASFESQLPHDLVASYGIRYTYTSTDLSDNSGFTNASVIMVMPNGTTIPAGGTAPASGGSTGKTHNSRAVFNAGLTYNGIENTSLRATWAQGFRSPLLQEMYLENSMGGGTVIGNPNLDPETSNNFEIGGRYSANGWNIDAAVFYSLAKDYITTEIIDAGTSTSRYMNADEAKTHGLELSVSKTLFGNYTPYATVTWMRRKIEASDYSTYDSNTPEFFARYGLRTSHDVFGGNLYTDTYARSQSATKSFSPSTGETTRIAGFTTVNFAAGYSFGKDGNYSLNAEFLNIFNQLYQYNTNGYEPGRHFNVKFTARY